MFSIMHVGVAAAVLQIATAGSSTAPAPSAAPAPQLEPVFTADVAIGEAIDVGATPLGGRSLVRITGGRFEGAQIRGTVLPGGWDWQLRAADGCMRLHADYFVRTDDGVTINIVNRARLCTPPGGKPGPIYSTPEFEAPVGRYGWLNAGAYVAAITPGDDPAHPSVRIKVYRVR